MNLLFIVTIVSTNVEKRKKTLQNVASGHIDDAVTPDDFENIIRSPPESKVTAWVILETSIEIWRPLWNKLLTRRTQCSRHLRSLSSRRSQPLARHTTMKTISATLTGIDYCLFRFELVNLFNISFFDYQTAFKCKSWRNFTIIYYTTLW